MSNEFTFSDLKRVHWWGTLKLTMARGFFSGIVWALVVLFGSEATPIEQVLAIPFVFGIFALPAALIYHLIGRILGYFIPLLGLMFLLIGSLMICVGDPIVYLINRSFPGAFYGADLSFFNFRPLLFILYPD